VAAPALPAWQALWLGRVPYLKALSLQRRLRARLLDDPREPGWLLLVEHPPVITLGRRSQPGDVRVPLAELRRRGVGVYRVERGGRATWHAPGQLVGYPLLHLGRAGLGAGAFVAGLARALQGCLEGLGVTTTWRGDAPGLWTPRGKIAALGLHTHREVTLHGFSLTLDADVTDLPRMIDPCGLGQAGLTSVLHERGRAPRVSTLARAIVALGLTPQAGRAALQEGGEFRITTPSPHTSRGARG